MFKTRTGNFPIGVRRGWGGWQRELPVFIEWIQEHGFSVVDLGRDARSDIPAVVEAGLKIGSVDLLEWEPMISPDVAKRADSVAKNAQYITDCTALGAKNFFCVMLPEDPSKSRVENFGYVVEALNGLAPALEKSGGRLVIEGYPGAGAQLCTPETYRAAFKEAPSMSLASTTTPRICCAWALIQFAF
jgi:sugar phosphate isomerase/epimerase